MTVTLDDLTVRVASDSRSEHVRKYCKSTVDNTIRIRF